MRGHLSYAKSEDLRSVSTDRLRSRLGSVSLATLDAISKAIRIILELP